MDLNSVSIHLVSHGHHPPLVGVDQPTDQDTMCEYLGIKSEWVCLLLLLLLQPLPGGRWRWWQRRTILVKLLSKFDFLLVLSMIFRFFYPSLSVLLIVTFIVLFCYRYDPRARQNCTYICIYCIWHIIKKIVFYDRC